MHIFKKIHKLISKFSGFLFFIHSNKWVGRLSLTNPEDFVKLQSPSGSFLSIKILNSKLYAWSTNGYLYKIQSLLADNIQYDENYEQDMSFNIGSYVNSVDVITLNGTYF